MSIKSIINLHRADRINYWKHKLIFSNKYNAHFFDELILANLQEIELSKRYKKQLIQILRYAIFVCKVFYRLVNLIAYWFVFSTSDSLHPVSKYPFSTPIRLVSVVHNAEVSSDVSFLLVEIRASLPSKTANRFRG